MKKVLIGVGAILMLAYMCGGGIHQQVGNDFIEQYEIAKAAGNHIDASVHAGVAAEAFLQAKDVENYNKWHDIADEEQRLGTAELMNSY